MIREDYLLSKRFINLLKTSLIFRSWANQYEPYLEDPSIIKSDPLIQSKRSQQPQTDFFINNRSPDRDLTRLFMENRNNKMVFEYLMAYQLLECNFGQLIIYLNYFKKGEKQKIPRHMEEAILLMKVMLPAKINMDAYHISRRTIQRFEKFHEILQQNLGDEQRAKIALAENFRDTYWYYLRYLSPQKTKVQL